MEKKILILLMSCWLLVSCGGKDSIQKYFVESSEKPNFTQLDISPKNLVKEELLETAQEREVLEAVKKINILIYQKKDDIDYQVEKERVNHILNSYDELIHFYMHPKKGAVRIEKKQTKVSELIVELSDYQKGFMLIRLLCDDLSLENLYHLGLLLENNKDLQGEIKEMIIDN